MEREELGDMWKRKRQNTYTIVIGCGQQSEQVASKLADAGKMVLLVDNTEDARSQIPGNIPREHLIEDVTSRKVLDRIRMDTASAVVLAMESENANIMIAQLAREEYHVPVVIALSKDPQRRFLYDRFGVRSIEEDEFNTERVMNYLISNKAG